MIMNLHIKQGYGMYSLDHWMLDMSKHQAVNESVMSR
jgi:hypothetical protein